MGIEFQNFDYKGQKNGIFSKINQILTPKTAVQSTFFKNGPLGDMET